MGTVAFLAKSAFLQEILAAVTGPEERTATSYSFRPTGAVYSSELVVSKLCARTSSRTTFIQDPTTNVRRPASAGSVEGDDTHGVELDSYFGGGNAPHLQLRP